MRYADLDRDRDTGGDRVDDADHGLRQTESDADADTDDDHDAGALTHGTVATRRPSAHAGTATTAIEPDGT
jgi:hypothetical protein